MRDRHLLSIRQQNEPLCDIINDDGTNLKDDDTRIDLCVQTRVRDLFTDYCGQYEDTQDGRSQTGEYQIVFGSLWICRVDPIIAGVTAVAVVGHLQENITGHAAVIPLTTNVSWRVAVVAIVQ